MRRATISQELGLKLKIEVEILIEGAMGDNTLITKIKINDHEYWMEPGFLFINGRHYNFKWLADGGMIIWLWNNDRDAADELRLMTENAPVIKALKSVLFERIVLDEKED
jgi:hypothetical protein